MSLSLRPSDDGDEMMASINTTPLVDVMLVLLIIFLITIPVATHTVPLVLPREANQVSRTKPQTVTIAVDHHGAVYWNQERLHDFAALAERLHGVAEQSPQPEIHVRGDEDARFEAVGRVAAACQRAGISKLSFITQQPERGG